MKVSCEKCGREWDNEHASECPFCYEITDNLKNPEMIMAKAYALQNDKSLRGRLLNSKREIAELYAAAAKMGEAEAQYEYARCLEEGIGVKKSIDNALVWYKCAARQGLSKAQYKLACLILDNCTVNNPSDIAYFWLRVSAEFGNPDAQYKLSHCYDKGEGTTPSPKHAIYWLAQSAESGSVTAALEIAEIFTEGKVIDANYAVARWFLLKYDGVSKQAHAMLSRLDQGIAESPENIIKLRRSEERYELGQRALKEKEYTIAYKLFYLSADEGYMPAQDRLAYCYINGYGVAADVEEGRRLLEAAHAKGCSFATLYLGDCYRDGIFERDYARAMEYYRRAAESGNAQAQYTLANCYFEGDIVECNIPLAGKWYEKAGSQGYEEALAKMQKIHQYVESSFNRGIDAEGIGDEETAFACYSEAAEFNHSGALCNLGKCYQKGTGCEKDYKKSVECYIRAISLGSDIARFNLGLCYLKGQGVEYSYKKARALMTAALDNGITEAKSVLDKMDERKRRKAAQRLYSTSCVVYKRGEANKALQIRLYAAKTGSARAQYLIGCHYEFGIGVEENRTTANMWYKKAAEGGYDTSKANLKREFLNSVVKTMLDN